jgi:hypothetical protein
MVYAIPTYKHKLSYPPNANHQTPKTPTYVTAPILTTHILWTNAALGAPRSLTSPIFTGMCAYGRVEMME